MKKLKIILFFNLIIILLFRVNYILNYNSVISTGENTIKGTISSIKYENDITTIELKSKEKLLVKYYQYIDLKIGDKVIVNGEVKEPDSSKVFNLFNYKRYLLSKRIYKIMIAKEIKRIKSGKSIKNTIYSRLNNINNSYLYTFILADNRINDEIYDTYQKNGISHLFSISGMHINLFALILLKIFNLLFKDKRASYIITIILLSIYMILIGTPSIIRSTLLFTFISLNKIFKLNIKTLSLLMLALYIMLLINPYYIYDIGFLYSYVISFALIRFGNRFKQKNYLIRLLSISIISFLFSFPITINNNFEINIFSPIINLLFVPFISYIIFPLSILSFIFPIFNPFFNIGINILESISLFTNKYSVFLSFGHINIYIIILYYLVLYSLLCKSKKSKIIIFILIILFQYNIHLFNFNNRLTMMDVGQGDSFLLEVNNKVVLIDTGGSIYYDYASNIIIPYLKSLGIRKIDYAFFSHGDFDHIGSSITLINNFRIDNIIMNSFEDNELEEELIKLSSLKKINLKRVSKEKIKIGNNYFYFLNNRKYEENKDSLIVYTIINGYGILFTGDSTKTEEHDLITDYQLKVDILKVAHHGSNTSTSKEFIDAVKPKYALISVGKNNRYGHPNNEVLEVLDKTQIYRTDENGSIMIRFKKDKLNISTCSP